jgi:hypothetical protein
VEFGFICNALETMRDCLYTLITTWKILIVINVLCGAFKMRAQQKYFYGTYKNMLHRIVELLWRITQYAPHN